MEFLSTGGIALKLCAVNKTTCLAVATAFPAHNDSTASLISRFSDYIDDKYPHFQDAHELLEIARKYIIQMRSGLILAGHDLATASQHMLPQETSTHTETIAAVNKSNSSSTVQSSMGMWPWLAADWADDLLVW